MAAYLNEWKTVEVNGRTIFVHRFALAGTGRGTPCVVFEAYEASRVCGEHSTITTLPEGLGGAWVGTLTSRPLPAEIAAIPVGPARWAALAAFRAANEAEAYAAIAAAFPVAVRIAAARRDGAIEGWGEAFFG